MCKFPVSSSQKWSYRKQYSRDENPLRIHKNLPLLTCFSLLDIRITLPAECSNRSCNWYRNSISLSAALLLNATSGAQIASPGPTALSSWYSSLDLVVYFILWIQAWISSRVVEWMCIISQQTILWSELLL